MTQFVNELRDDGEVQAIRLQLHRAQELDRSGDPSFLIAWARSCGDTVCDALLERAGEAGEEEQARELQGDLDDAEKALDSLRKVARAVCSAQDESECVDKPLNDAINALFEAL